MCVVLLDRGGGGAGGLGDSLQNSCMRQAFLSPLRILEGPGPPLSEYWGGGGGGYSYSTILGKEIHCIFRNWGMLEFLGMIIHRAEVYNGEQEE